MQRYSSVTLHVSPKNPISAEKLKITFATIQILPWHFFPEWFGLKQIEAICFWNEFHDKSAQTGCSKEMWVPILKGLKYLNPVLGGSHGIPGSGDDIGPTSKAEKQRQQRWLSGSSDIVTNIWNARGCARRKNYVNYWKNITTRKVTLKYYS